MTNIEEFKSIDIVSYVIDGIKTRSLVFSEVKKFQRIIARQGIEG